MELEAQVKDVTAQKDKLNYENTALKKGLKDGNVMRDDFLDKSVLDTDAVAG